MENSQMLRQQADTWKSMKERIDSAIVRVSRTAELVRDNAAIGATSSDEATEYAAMRGMAEELVRMSAMAEARHKTMRACHSELTSGADGNASAPLAELYSTQLGATKPSSGAVEAMVVKNKYVRKIASLADPNEPGDDEVVMETQLAADGTFKCPCTGLDMEDPVRSTICGHVFSKQGIESHIKTMNKVKRLNPNHEAKCPVAGCPERVSVASLDEDVETQMALRERAHRTATQALRASRYDDDVDNIGS